MPCPRGGDWLADELAALHRLGAETLVGLLTPAEQVELELRAEESFAVAAGLHFVAFPIPDFSVPPLNRFTLNCINDLAVAAQSGRQIVIHCRAGIGRSSLIAAAVLTLLGLTPAQAFERITTARGRPVPDTVEQRHWVEQFASLAP